MDFNLPPDADPRRLEVREWLTANTPCTPSKLARRGFAVPHWPRPWGLAAEAELQLIIDDEIARAGIRSPSHMNPAAVNNCAQSLLTFGTKAQQDRFIAPALAAEEIWCMLFSEPASGSDLGALRTQARRDGDHYVISGQKTWTSLANKAQIGVLPARSDPALPKHAGLTQFPVDMDSPGISVRPIRDMTGATGEYNEVFFDDVRVPAERRLGDEGQGWKIAMTQL